MRRNRLNKQLRSPFSALLYALLGILALSALLTRGSSSFAAPDHLAAAPPDYWLEPLAGNLDLASWFEAETGFTPSDDYFGAYVAEAISDTLYLGFGAARPGESDGALLASSDGISLSAVYTPSEQGMLDFVPADGKLIIPGPDPCCNDDWTWGNTYILTPPASVVKLRNLPNVIHTWGLWRDAASSALYAATGSHTGDSITYLGELFRSDDQAASWTRLAAGGDIGLYRTYDVIGFDGKLVITWNDIYGEACGLAESSDEGQSWTRLAGQTTCRTRLLVYGDKLLALNGDQTGLLAVDTAGAITSQPFPDFVVDEWTYNYATVDGDGRLNVASAAGRIMRSSDLVSWEEIAAIDRPIVSLGYWPAKNWLIVATRGRETASLWKLDLSRGSGTALSQPARNVILMIADGWGPNQIDAANAYAGSVPAYQTWPRTFMSTYPAGGSYDPNQAWADFTYVKSGTTDSAAAATALYSGVKTANGRINVSSDGSSRLSTISELAREQGRAAGAVSTVYISHATPGAWMGHNSSRGNGYAIADEGLWGDPNTTGTILDSIRYGGGQGQTQPPLDVVIGAGHPDWQGGSYVNEAIRDKLAAESGQPAAFTFVERVAGSADGGPRLLAAAADPGVTRLAALFGGSGGNIEYRLADGSGHNPENPSLAEMSRAALAVLGRDPNGFALMIEGGAVDWAGHSNNMDRMIGEMLGFNEAVQAVIDWIEDEGNGSSWDDTLLLITGDHETGYLTAGPGVFADRPLGLVNATTLALEKQVASSGRRASWDDLNGNAEIDPDETVYWAWNSGSHTNSLIPLYAKGAGDYLLGQLVAGHDPVRGAYLDNTAVHTTMNAALTLPDSSGSLTWTSCAGQQILDATGAPLAAGSRVELWDAGRQPPLLLGMAQIDPAGQFSATVVLDPGRDYKLQTKAFDVAAPLPADPVTCAVTLPGFDPASPDGQSIRPDILDARVICFSGGQIPDQLYTAGQGGCRAPVFTTCADFSLPWGVGLEDLTMVAERWNPDAASASPVDLNGDEVIDIADILLGAAQWNQVCF